MDTIINYLESGKLSQYANQPAVTITIFNFSEITNIITPTLGGGSYTWC